MKTTGSKHKNIIWFENLRIADVPAVGGKNAALGEMVSSMSRAGVDVPGGFAVTASAYRNFLAESGLDKFIENELRGLDTKNMGDLHRRAGAIRAAIIKTRFSKLLIEEIQASHRKLQRRYGAHVDMAVRSSATAEDLPDASFAGQQETFLNIVGFENLLVAVKKCFASLFTDRAVSYRHDKKFSHLDAALSVGVQKMIRSDLAASGVAFTLDTETGFDKVVEITGSWGLGEMIVQGKVVPDEFTFFKPTGAIISKKLGSKQVKLVYAEVGTKKADVAPADRARFCLTDAEVKKLAGWCLKIENHFGHPMDIEWAKDGRTGRLFIVQARPETVQSQKDKNSYQEYRLLGRGKIVVEGIAVGTKIGAGRARIIRSPKKIGEFRRGEVLITEITDPDWEPIMKIASAIVTDKGGRTSHAAIVSRELGIPCVVGTEKATAQIQSGRDITVDCSSGSVGRVYDGKLKFKIKEHHLGRLPKTRTRILVNIGSPEEAFAYRRLPARGVGLGRLEFIIAEGIGIHPNALVEFESLAKDFGDEGARVRNEIDKRTAGYKNKTEFYVDKLAEGIATIAAAFYPDPVIIRFSDFKTNEYRKLLGGEFYEPREENPMIGWRGASRYVSPRFARAFALECRALERVRRGLKLTNAIPMIPFCRTPQEGEKVVSIMAQNGLDRRRDRSLKIYVMCEIPSNILEADEFLKIFDGMSIGSNDLTQLTLGLDRDSQIVASEGNENSDSVKYLIKTIIKKCRARKKYSGLCGQAPSDYPGFMKFLVDAGIESISLNPDAVVKGIITAARQERRVRRFKWLRGAINLSWFFKNL